MSIVSVSFYNELPISVDLPKQVVCKIETTDVALKGQTVSSSYKPAKLNNGLNKNEVTLVSKTPENKGFFERFFQLFS